MRTRVGASSSPPANPGKGICSCLHESKPPSHSNATTLDAKFMRPSVCRLNLPSCALAPSARPLDLTRQLQRRTLAKRKQSRHPLENPAIGPKPDERIETLRAFAISPFFWSSSPDPDAKSTPRPKDVGQGGPCDEGEGSSKIADVCRCLLALISPFQRRCSSVSHLVIYTLRLTPTPQPPPSPVRAPSDA